MAYKSNYHAEKIKKQHNFFKPPLIPLPFAGEGVRGDDHVSFPFPLIPWAGRSMVIAEKFPGETLQSLEIFEK
jgi:hypothetical protein